MNRPSTLASAWSRAVVSGWLALGAWCVALPAVAQPVTVHTLAVAERTLPGAAPQRVALPDWLLPSPTAPGPGTGPVEAVYRLAVDLGPAPAQAAVYLPGLFGHLRLAINGHVISDGLVEPLPPTPRSSGRLRLIDIPAPYLQPGANRLEITVRAQRTLSLSRVIVGPPETLRLMRDRKAFGLVHGPGLVATIMLCVGLGVLLLYLRRRQETLYAYFGAAALAWGLHTWWTVLPWPLLDGHHLSVWWTALYSLVVAALANFALRFADYRWPRVERTLWAATALAPLVFYAAHAFGGLFAVLEAWRLGMVVVAFGGLVAVALSAWRKRSTESALLVLAGLAAASLGFVDWFEAHRQDDNLPVTYAPWAGVPFVMLVTWFLIDRFVLATESLEAMNRELEMRVAHKSSELVAAVQSMRSARDAAEQANRAKSSFLAAASHDLRQPMHALGLYLATLRSQPLGAAQRELTERMAGSVAALESMFDSLLDISRMDAGVVVPEPRVFDVGALVQRLAGDFAAEAERRGLRLSVRVGAAPRELRAFTDPLLLERVLRNLLANAVKYTTAGGVLVSCRPRRGPPPCWRIEVWDTGIGIPAHEQARVFDEFYQVGNPARERRAGLGIGLSVVRRLTGLLRLPLALRSQPGRGSRFGVDVPATTAPESPTVEAAAAGSVAGLGVAVIEDDLEVRDGMQRLLADWGCRVAAGASADEVERSAQAQALTIGAVIADLRLRGGRDGIGEIEALRQRRRPALPALLVSGDSAPDRVALMQHSGLPWLAKPVSAARLRSWLVLAARFDDGSARAAPVAPPEHQRQEESP
jgi:signal transduction histidine kinase/CheY-like chemotaxis protein